MCTFSFSERYSIKKRTVYDTPGEMTDKAAVKLQYHDPFCARKSMAVCEFRGSHGGEY